MGARTVAGEMVTVPMVRLGGTGFRGAGSRAGAPAPHECSGTAWRTRVSAPHELSQNFFTVLFYLPLQNEALAGARAVFLILIP
jgi:hypothetical protein